MKHSLSTYKDGWQVIEFCKVCSKEGTALQGECVPIETQYQRMARLAGFNPNLRESWPLDLLDKLIALENAKGQQELFYQIDIMNGLTSKNLGTK